MKVGIATFYDAYNCGAFLQAFALQKKIHNLGAEPCFIDQNATIGRYGLKKYSGGNILDFLKYTAHYANEFFPGWLRKRRFDRCIGQHFSVERRQAKFDCLISGSDQVWNPELVGCKLGAYLLNEFKGHTNKNAYAASFGIRKLNPEHEKIVAAALTEFRHISVREDAGAMIVKKLTGRDVPVVLDPTLLLNSSDYEEVETERLVNGRYLCAYSVGDDNQLRRYACELAKRMGIKLVFIQNGRMGVWGGGLTDWRITSPDRFLSLVRYSDCLVTNGFHGTLFSIIYHKPFLTLVEKAARERSRFETTLANLELSAHLVDNTVNVERASELMWCDFSAVDARLGKSRRVSLEALQTILKD